MPGTGGFEWSGYLDVRDLPQSFNPKAGWLATANHNILPDGYKHQIGYEFAPPYRFQRIRDLLASKEKWELEDFRAIQHDDTFAARPGPRRAAPKDVDLQDKNLEPYAKLLTEWDGRLSVDAQAGPLYAIWLRELQTGVLRSARAEGAGSVARHARRAAEHARGAGETRREVVRRRTRRRVATSCCARRSRAAVEKLKKLPDGAATSAGARCTPRRSGTRSRRSTPAIAKAFNVGPFERPGDANTPNNTRYDDKFQQLHGATYRHLIDLADWDRALATSAPGQSGQPGSPHYADLAPLWAKGEYFPLDVHAAEGGRGHATPPHARARSDGSARTYVVRVR